jgi:hypothetical protein
MKVSTEKDNNFGYEQITILVDNIPLILHVLALVFSVFTIWGAEVPKVLLMSLQILNCSLW